MNSSASVNRFHEGSSGPSRPRPEEPLGPTLASVVALLEEIAGLQKETAELLWELAGAQDLATIQRPSKGNDPIRRLTSVQSGLPAQPGPGDQPGPGEGPPRRPASHGRPGWLAEPLTQQEQVVLRMLTTDLSLREIGQELYLSVNTVKSHTRAVYQKLGVSSLREALRRGRELGILPELAATGI